MSDKNTYPSTLADKVLVRMPDGMRDQLKDAAKANNRTMNAEIVARLERSTGDDLDIPLRDARLAQLNMQLKIVQAGLRLSQLASQFLLLESPAVGESKSYDTLIRAIAAAMEGAPEQEAESYEDRLSAAKSAIEKLVAMRKEAMKFEFPVNTSLEQMADLASDAVDVMDPLLLRPHRQKQT